MKSVHWFRITSFYELRFKSYNHVNQRRVTESDDKNEAAAKLISKGLEPAESGSDIYKIGEEFLIALRGTNQVESIQIWFSDKELKDRHY